MCSLLSDILLMFVSGYVNTKSSSDHFGEFTVKPSDLNLFDKNDRMREKIAQIRNLTTMEEPEQQCPALLNQLTTACETAKETCEKPNEQSFSLSIDEVCNSVNSPVKLYFSKLGEYLDGYASEDGACQYTHHLFLHSRAELLTILCVISQVQ